MAAGNVVRDALVHLKIVGESEAVGAADMADGLRSLNLMVRAWEADGIALGWTDVANPADELPTLPEYEEALGYNLALRLRARYGVTLDPDVIAFAQSGLATITAGNVLAQDDRLSYDVPGVYSRLDPRSC